MAQSTKPITYISYSWLTKQEDGKVFRAADERAFELAERLRKAGIDSRLDMYFLHSQYGFTPPSPIYGDKRDPWLTWAGEQIQQSDCVILFCTAEYTSTDPDSGDCPGEWCAWHQLDDETRLKHKRASLWWDWHHMAKELETGISKPQKFIPVGYGPYYSHNVPGFIRGATYYNLSSEKDFNGLLLKIKHEHLKNNPRKGVFISYAHNDEPRWLDLLLRHLKPLEKTGVEIWTDKEIGVGQKWNDSIQHSLAKASVAILLVTPAFLESNYIASNELPAFLHAAESEGLIIFWIPVKPSSYKETEIAQFQAAHSPAKPLSGLRGANLEQAFVDIASKLKNALNNENIKKNN